MAPTTRSASWRSYLNAFAGCEYPHVDRTGPRDERDRDAAAPAVSDGGDPDRQAGKRHRHRCPTLCQTNVLNDAGRFDRDHVAVRIDAVQEHDPTEATSAVQHVALDLPALLFRQIQCRDCCANGGLIARIDGIPNAAAQICPPP